MRTTKPILLATLALATSAAAQEKLTVYTLSLIHI